MGCTTVHLTPSGKDSNVPTIEDSRANGKYHPDSLEVTKEVWGSHVLTKAYGNWRTRWRQVRTTLEHVELDLEGPGWVRGVDGGALRNWSNTGILLDHYNEDDGTVLGGLGDDSGCYGEDHHTIRLLGSHRSDDHTKWNLPQLGVRVLQHLSPNG